MAKRMQYGEETVVMRVPKSMVKEVKNMLEARKVIEAVKVDVTKEHPVVAQVLNTFMVQVSKQMASYLSLLENDATESGDLERLQALESMKPYFQDIAGSSPAPGRLI
jgi:hypothetical protein